MSPFRRPFALLLAALLLAAPAAAGAVCTAAQIIALEPGCGAVSCTIAGTHVVDAVGCTFDFGTRNVTLTGRLSVGARTATVRAASLVINPTGYVEALGTAVGARGGLVVIETSGAFETKQGARIDASGNLSGGDIIVRSGGSITHAGRLVSDGRNVSAAGGLIDLTAGAAITTTAQSVLSAAGGNDSDGGGEISLVAGGSILMLSDPAVNGLDGGFVDIRSGDTVTMQGANASGAGDAGSGGCIDVVGERGATVLGTITANGAAGTFMTGGCGGLICLDGDAGTLRLGQTGRIFANGASPDGGGGQVSLLGLGAIEVTGAIEARGPTGLTCGGDICIDAGLDATVQGTTLNASGGDAGGQIEITAGRTVSVNATLNASGNGRGSLGGDVGLRAGLRGYGALTFAGRLDVSSNNLCSIEEGCGQGGLSDLAGCDVTIQSGTVLVATGPDAGEHNIAARERLTVAGQLTATRTVQTGVNGANRLLHRFGVSPITTGATFMPAAAIVPLTTCPATGPTTPPCLDPCPPCGNGIVEFPETCDPTAGPPVSCDGCSLFCQVEDCDDGLFCTADSCITTLGCRHQPQPVCTEPPTPTATVTGTPPTATPSRTPTFTRTVTSTPSATPTASATASATPTQSASVTATASVTPTAADTATATPTAAATTTASVTPTAADTATATATPTASATATDSPAPTDTATPDPTATATATATAAATDTATATPSAEPTATDDTPACAGDCNGDGAVTVNELITGVNIALGNSPASACPVFDRSGDGTVSIAELIAAVNAALGGC